MTTTVSIIVGEKFRFQVRKTTEKEEWTILTRTISSLSGGRVREVRRVETEGEAGTGTHQRSRTG